MAVRAVVDGEGDGFGNGGGGTGVAGGSGAGATGSVVPASSAVFDAGVILHQYRSGQQG